MASNQADQLRDVTSAEGHSQVRTGTGPRAMASLRNLAISILRIYGAATVGPP